MLNFEGKSRTLVSRALRDKGQKRKRTSGVNLQALTRMKREASDHAYAGDRNEKSYTEYENQETMKGAENGIKGFSEDLPAKKLSLKNGNKTNCTNLYNL